MSGTFKGFTDKDIEDLKNPKKDIPKTSVKKAALTKKISPHSVILKKVSGDQKFEIIDQRAKLYVTAPLNDTMGEDISEMKPNEAEKSPDAPDNVNNEEHPDVNSCEMKEVILDNCSEGVKEMEKPVNLEEFQKHQKLMEEQNRKKKEMLSRALEDRSKKTEEEVEKLKMIKKELQTLDMQLSDDVSILRKKIDKACLIYAEAEKNYFRVEKEFLCAKLTLQKERERKELLTEHLCTLIAHNEARKAKKLESLMDQLAYASVKQEDEKVTMKVCDGVCELTGKMLEMENGEVIIRDD